MVMVLPLPLPPPEATVQAFYWFVVAGFFARGIGKKLDWEVQQTGQFKSLPGWLQYLVKKVLDLTHHWYIGWGIMVYPYWFAARTPFSWLECYWIGLAILLDDIPDLPPRIQKLFENYKFMRWW